MGDVASLLGRIFNAIFLAFVVSTIVVTSPLQAAPFAAIVMDGRTGEVLYEKNADARLHPASLTKMMTLYMLFESIERGDMTLDTRLTASRNAARQPPSRRAKHRAQEGDQSAHIVRENARRNGTPALRLKSGHRLNPNANKS